MDNAGFVLVVCIIGLIYIGIHELMKKEKREVYSKTPDEELIREFDELVDKIGNEVAIAINCKGVGSNMAVDACNNRIRKYRETGMMVAEELQKRGYTVNCNALNGTARKAASTGNSNVIKSAVVGGIIAGGPGAVVGAVHAMDKNNQQNNKK